MKLKPLRPKKRHRYKSFSKIQAI